MEIKTKQHKIFPLLCGLLVVIACCFRTMAVLKESDPQIPPEEIEPFIYLLRKDGEERDLWESIIEPDITYVEIDNRCGANFDKELLFQKENRIQITEEPCVLIIHTHGSEAYVDQEGYRSTDPSKNVIRVGQEIADRLNRAGIPTIHDRTAHDVTEGYDLAYEQAAQAIATYLDIYPSIQVVIDVHRDAASDGQGGQKGIYGQIGEESAAALLLVMGTDTGELPHENWQDNLSFAMQLQACLDEKAPGIMRPTSLRGARYNEHFTPCSVLLEVGAAGNTMEEALRSGGFFGDCLAQLLWSMDR